MSRRKGITGAIVTIAQICAAAALFAAVHGGAGAGATGSINITGTVTGPTGASVADVSVYATDPGGSTVDFGPVSTASDGTYDLPVSAGVYDFHFDPVSGSGLNPVVDSDVTVLGDQTINIQLTPTTHTFSGTLTDSDGNPIPGVELTLVGSNNNDYNVTTDSSGNFSVTVSADTYSVELTDNGYGTYLSTSLELGLTGQLTENLTSSDVTQNLTLDTATLSITMKDASGNPEPNQGISFYDNRYVSGGSATISAGGNNYPLTIVDDNGAVTTNSDGVATALLPLGSTYAAGEICATFADGTQQCNSSAVTVNGPVNLAFNETATHTFSGTLTDSDGNPIPGVELTLVGSNNNDYNVTTDSSGNFSVTVSADTYSVELTDNGYGTYLSTSLELGLTGQLTENLTSSDVTQNLTLDTATLSITMKDASGNPEPNQGISFYDNRYVSGGSATISAGGNNYPLTIVDDNGAVTTNSDGVATALLPLGSTYAAGEICATFADGTQQCNSSAVTVNGPVNLAFNETATHTFSGTLTDSDGNPIPGVELTLVGSNNNDYNVTTDSSGNFSVTVSADTYSVELTDNGYGTYLSTSLELGLTGQLTENLTSSDVTQNLTLDTATLSITMKDASGNPEPNQGISFYDNRYVSGGSATISAGGNNYPLTIVDDNGAVTTNSDGVATALLPLGSTYAAGEICATFADGTQQCNNTAITVLSNTNLVFQEVPPVPSAPTNLTAPSPTNQAPSLTWTASSGVTTYNVYRNGTNIGSTTSTNYTDTTAPQGMNSYYVTAVNGGGESAASNTIIVVYETTPPTITYTVSPTPNSSGWNNSPVTVTFNCTDNSGTGIASCSSPMTESADGTYTLTGTAVDNAGNTASVNVTVNLDQTPPAVGTPSLSPSTITAGQNTTLTVPAADILSGVTDGEYYIGNNDPGRGNGTAMTYDSSTGTLSASFGSNLAAGTYTVNARAEDAAGNWSGVATTTLTVNPAVPSAPTNLTATSPTTQPALSWDASSGATSYNIYRDGVDIASSTTASYTDTTAIPGTYDYYVTAVNATGESSSSNTISVMVGTAPTITSTNNASTGMRVPFSFTVTTTGNPTPSLTETGSLPTGITFADNGDGTATISGEAAAGTDGTYPITIDASNGLSPDATQSFTLAVNTNTSAPAITSSNNDTETYGVPYSFTVTTDGYPAPSLTKSGGSLPSGVTFTDNGDGTATIAGTPDESAVGVYSFTITAKNGVSPNATQSYTLTITKAPVIKNLPNTSTAQVGTAYSLTVKTSGYSTPSLTASGNLPNGLSFTDNGDGTATISGTPAVGSGNAYSITITATNQLGSSSQTFTLKVDEGPVITSTTSATATVGQTFSFQVTATGYPSPTLKKSGTLPRGLSWKASTGTISGTVASNATPGTYPLTFTAKNSTGTVTQSFTLTVQN